MTLHLVNPDSLRDPGEVAELAVPLSLPAPANRALYVPPAEAFQVAALVEAARNELECAGVALDEQEFRARLITGWALLKTALGAAENMLRETGDLQ
ncbi:hypothetical protein [Deinococcus fonticola]|uniref:hypothetical protein n=1 Tax=Deinococcus fonticola TaxID=2528713 RepID=UPI00107540DA|nr:hypothetical protein [Deinococcus fonticola]